MKKLKFLSEDSIVKCSAHFHSCSVTESVQEFEQVI